MTRNKRNLRSMLLPRGTRRERSGRWAIHIQQRFRDLAWQSLGPIVQLSGLRLKRWLGLGSTSWFGARPGCADVGPTDIAAGRPGLVSVVLPVYRPASLLRNSVESVLAQTHDRFELIVIIQEAADGAERTLVEYADHPKVRLLTQEGRPRLEALRNAFEFASGEFWTWISAGDLMEPKQLERQVGFLRANPEAAVVGCEHPAIDGRSGLGRDAGSWSPGHRPPQSSENHVRQVPPRSEAAQAGLAGAGFMYRGAWGQALGAYAQSAGTGSCDDWLRVSALFSIGQTGADEPDCRHRAHERAFSDQEGESRGRQHARRVITDDEQRRSFYGRPWHLIVDEPTIAWLGDIPTDPHTIETLAESHKAGRSDKCLALVQADSLHRVREDRLAGEAVVAAWVPRAAGSMPYDRRLELADVADVAFAADADTHRRLRLFLRDAFLMEPGPPLLKFVLACANSRLFAARSTPFEQRRPALPRVFAAREPRGRALLQVEDFVHGGLEQVVLDLAAVLQAEHWTVRILVLGQEGPAATRARKCGIQLLRLPTDGRKAAYRKLLKDETISIVNAHHSYFGADMATERGIPFVQTVHNTYVWLSAREIRTMRAADAHTCAYLCVSPNVARYTDFVLGLPADKLVVVPNGIASDRFRDAHKGGDRAARRAALGFRPEDVVFLHSGTVVPAKGQLPLVKAAARARRRNPRIRIAMAGAVMDEVYYGRVRATVAETGAADVVRYLGFNENVEQLYALADAFVLPSYWEGWSLGLAEALTAGLPVIATDVGGARDVLAQTGGILLPAPAPLLELDAHSLRRALQHPDPEFVDRLTEALVRIAGDPDEPELRPHVPPNMDRRVAYAGYARLFEWICMGGEPAAGRPWLWELHRAHSLSRPG